MKKFLIWIAEWCLAFILAIMLIIVVTLIIYFLNKLSIPAMKTLIISSLVVFGAMVMIAPARGVLKKVGKKIGLWLYR